MSLNVRIVVTTSTLRVLDCDLRAYQVTPDDPAGLRETP